MSTVHNFILKFFKVEEKAEELKKSGKDRFVMYGVNYYKKANDTSPVTTIDTLFLRDGECFFEAYKEKGFFNLNEVVEICDLSLSSFKHCRTKHLLLFIRYYNTVKQNPFAKNGFDSPPMEIPFFKTDLHLLNNRCTTHPAVKEDSSIWGDNTVSRGGYSQYFTRSDSYMKKITIDTKPIV